MKTFVENEQFLTYNGKKLITPVCMGET